VPGPAVKIAELAVRDANVGRVRVAVNDPCDGIARHMMLAHGIAHVHQFGGRRIFKKKNAFFGAKPFESEGALEEVGNVHIIVRREYVPAICQDAEIKFWRTFLGNKKAKVRLGIMNLKCG
jgi:hypothetical protein